MFKLIFVFFIFIIFSCQDATEKVFSNYKENQNKIDNVTKYFLKICPSDLRLRIRFNSKTDIYCLFNQKLYTDSTTWVKSDIFDKYGQFDHSSTSPNDKKLLKALKLIGWNHEKLDSLYFLLKDAECNSIGNENSLPPLESRFPTISVGFIYPKYDLYRLEYIVIDRELTKNQIDTLLNDCSIKRISDKVFVQYSGPSFGSNCFPDKR